MENSHCSKRDFSWVKPIWFQGIAGIANAILLLIICTTLALISVLSTIGIYERCQIQSGGIYFLVSHVLGGQIGGAVGLMYAFGQVNGDDLMNKQINKNE